MKHRILACTLCGCLLTGCSSDEQHRIYSAQEAETLLEEAYGLDFTLASENEGGVIPRSDGQHAMEYVFCDPSGVTCNVLSSARYGGIGWSGHEILTEDYRMQQVADAFRALDWESKGGEMTAVYRDGVLTLALETDGLQQAASVLYGLLMSVPPLAAREAENALKEQVTPEIQIYPRRKTAQPLCTYAFRTTESETVPTEAELYRQLAEAFDVPADAYTTAPPRTTTVTRPIVTTVPDDDNSSVTTTRPDSDDLRNTSLHRLTSEMYLDGIFFRLPFYMDECPLWEDFLWEDTGRTLVVDDLHMGTGNVHEICIFRDDDTAIGRGWVFVPVGADINDGFLFAMDIDARDEICTFRLGDLQTGMTMQEVDSVLGAGLISKSGAIYQFGDGALRLKLEQSADGISYVCGIGFMRGANAQNILENADE